MGNGMKLDLQATKPKRILVALNNSRVSQEALVWACEIAKRYRAQLYAVYVIEVKRALPLTAAIEPERRQGEEILAQAERIVEEQHYEVETDLLQARAAGPALVEEVVEKQVDLLVIGLSHKQRFGRFDLGQTVPYVLRHAPCRVLALREALDQRE